MLDERDPAALKAFAQAALKHGAPVVVLAARAPEPALVVMRARELSAPDLKAIAPELLALAQGRGGGGSDLLTVVARDAALLDAAYRRALELAGATEDPA
jgi:alanyl-tRNA synthetase